MAAIAIEQEVKQAALAFDISVDRRELVRQVAAARAVVTNKITIPILGSLLLHADAGVLTITASDLDSTVQVSCPAKVMLSGSCTVPARKFYEYVKLLPDGDVKIVLRENHWVHIRSGRSSTKMVGLPAANFPKTPAGGENEFHLAADQILRLIALSGFAVGEEESRYTIAGGLLVVRKDEAQMVATDGHRLALAAVKADIDVTGERKLSIPAKSLGLLKQIYGDSSRNVTISEDDKMLRFTDSTRVLVSRKMAGVFPNYAAAMPVYSLPGITLDADHVLPAIERSMLIADDQTGALSLGLTSSILSIKAASQNVGKSDEEIDIYGGPDEVCALKIGFNGAYLRDALRLMSGPFTLYVKDANSAAMIEHATEDGYLFRYVIMPMRAGS